MGRSQILKMGSEYLSDSGITDGFFNSSSASYLSPEYPALSIPSAIQYRNITTRISRKFPTRNIESSVHFSPPAVHHQTARHWPFLMIDMLASLQSGRQPIASFIGRYDVLYWKISPSSKEQVIPATGEIKSCSNFGSTRAFSNFCTGEWKIPPSAKTSRNRSEHIRTSPLSLFWRVPSKQQWSVWAQR